MSSYVADLQTTVPALKEGLAVARGEKPADLLLSGARVVNVLDGSITEQEVAVYQGRIVGLGSGYCARVREDLSGLYLVPGFIDGHLHVESSLLTPAQLAKVVSPRGTTALVADAHEIANVLGRAGLDFMLADSENLGVSFFFTAPSCVPSTDLETSGAVMTAADLAPLKDHPRIVALGEMMNYPGLTAGRDEVLSKVAAFDNRIMDGHAPGLSGQALNAYIYAGPDSDHECISLKEAREKLAKGMWIMIRQGTSAQNLPDLLPLVNPLTVNRCLLVSDDPRADILAEQGHLDAMLHMAVARGLDPVLALRMVTCNPAARFLMKNRGCLAPGFWADLAAVHDLRGFKVEKTWHQGRLTAAGGRSLPLGGAEADPVYAALPLKVGPLNLERFKVRAAGPRVRAMRLVDKQIYTEEALVATPQRDGYLQADPERDLALITVLERHRASGRTGYGLVQGFKLKKGALASSVAHDSHNLVVVGMDHQSLQTAASRVAELGGGLCAAQGTQILGQVPLPMAGLMSPKPCGQVLAELKDLQAALAQICEWPEPFMTMAFLSLAVIPELKITDLGLVRVNEARLVDLFA